jgi:hypothetical protein
LELTIGGETPYSRQQTIRAMLKGVDTLIGSLERHDQRVPLTLHRGQRAALAPTQFGQGKPDANHHKRDTTLTPLIALHFASTVRMRPV